jgi:DNA-binding Xre family transcriptional regulator
MTSEFNLKALALNIFYVGKGREVSLKAMEAICSLNKICTPEASAFGVHIAN